MLRFPPPKRVTSFWEVVSPLLLGCGVGEVDVCTSKGSPSVVWSWLRCKDHRFTSDTNIHFWTNLLWLSLLDRIDFSNGREKMVSYKLSYTCHEETLYFFYFRSIFTKHLLSLAPYSKTFSVCRVSSLTRSHYTADTALSWLFPTPLQKLSSQDSVVVSFSLRM